MADVPLPWPMATQLVPTGQARWRGVSEVIGATDNR
jgi:hypothetical protein